MCVDDAGKGVCSEHIYIQTLICLDYIEVFEV
jgi:hypothetical protein